jgi:hypothetical protein
VAQG